MVSQPDVATNTSLGKYQFHTSSIAQPDSRHDILVFEIEFV